MQKRETDLPLNAIAVIGMACRVPGARNLEEFWRNLSAGKESIATFSDRELIEAGEDPASLPPNYVRCKGIIEDVECFDADLFGIHPREAEIMDPQHRVFLECAWEALESAGYDPGRYDGVIGVYGGANLSAYLLHVLSNEELVNSLGRIQIGIGNDKDHLTTRVAYKLGLTGPAVTVQTACSTSLVAVHMACQSLLNGECDLALAGGVSITIPQKTGYLYQQGGIFSPDGHCRAFDAKSEGTVFSNGAGVVVLKRLEDALADGDVIHAVIRGSAINNDGSLKVGYTAPGMDGQSSVITEAQEVSDIDVETIGYVEAHGTGTPLGDPVEVAALTQAFRAHTDKKQFCAIGSVKTNIGHLDTAAGVAGLIKAVLCLKAGQIPPSLHFNSPNPQIDFENSPFYVNTQLSGWPLEGPRRAAVSSFGIGGTNAHVILEQAPPPPRATAAQPQDGRCFLLPLSAATPTALRQVALRLEQFLISQPDCRLADVAFTLQTGRRELAYRSYVVARTSAEAAAELRKPPGMRQAASRPLFFLFPGQGSQFVNCGRWLYSREGVFRQTLESCARLLEEDLGENICGLLMPEEGRKEEASRRLRQTRITQPALFALEYALARQLMAWGLKPAGLLGHSLGEIVAATLAGVMSLEDGLRLVSARGAAMQRRPAGAMLSVGIGASELEPELGPELSLAAINLPDACVASGPEREIERLEREMSSRGVMTKRLETSHGFHSWMMEGAAEEVREEARKLSLGGPRITVFSNVSGRRLREEEARSAEYWAEQMLRPVRFSECVGEMLKEEKAMVLEVGPGGGLWALVNRHPERKAEQIVARSMRRREEREEEEEEILKKALGEAWSGGQEVNWREMERGERGRRVTLPCYPFERKRYWVERSEADKSREAREKKREGEWYYAPVWKQSLRVERERREGERRRWMVMVDEEGIGERVSERLRREGEKVWVVRRGEEYRRAGEAEYEIRVESAEDYRRLWEELSERGETPSNILHMWTVERADQLRDRISFMERMLNVGFYSLIYLTQAIGGVSLAASLQIEIVSNGLYRLGSDLESCPEKGVILGPCRVIPKEYPNISCRLIDLPLHFPDAVRGEKLVTRLLSEVTGRQSDSVVAYRGNQRWTQTFDPIQGVDLASQSSGLPEKGVYLITGGLGGIGLVLADYFARHARNARLVLVGRSGLPARDEWDLWLDTHEKDHPTSVKISKLRQIEDAGADVTIFRSDVTDETQMSEVISRTLSRFGRINGVVHAAGVPGGGIIQLKTREAADDVFLPKLKGALILDKLLKDTPLDFFVLCSSALAITGSAGQVGYCAANSFLDLFATASISRPWRQTVSINWDAWKNIGMTARKASPSGPGDIASGKAGQLVDHSLIRTRISESSEKEIFITEFQPSRHWVLDEHRIFDKAVMPGSAYLEMARAAYEAWTRNESVEIREVVFLAPLIVGDGESHEARTVLERRGDEFGFKIISRAGSANAAWQTHVTGRLIPCSGSAPRKRRIEDLLRKLDQSPAEKYASGKVGMEGAGKKGQGFVFGPRWNCLKQVFIGRGEILSRVELPEEYLPETAQLKLHPALLDVATGVAVRLFGKDVYVPLSYQSVIVKGPAPGKMYSHIQFEGQDFSGKETISYDVAILDETGNEWVTITGFLLRRVSEMTAKSRGLFEEASGEDKKPSESAQSRERSSAGAFQGIDPEDGLRALGDILAWPDLTQVIVSPRKTAAAEESAVAFRRQSQDLTSFPEQPNRILTHQRPNLRTDYVAPKTEIEKRLVEIWQDLFGIEKIGLRDNFFEMGGHSLLALQILSRVQDSLGVDVSINTLFETPTVEALARVVEQSILGSILGEVNSLSEEEAMRMLGQSEALSI